MKLARFLSDLGSQKGAPGGGAAAALTGASGAALVEMISRLNDKRLKDSSGNAQEAAAYRVRLQGLIAKDAAAFEAMTKVYPLRKKRPLSWQRALKSAAEPPMEICKSCASAAKLAKREKKRTSAWLESDRREALILLRAAFESAKLNVDINLKGLRDDIFVKRARRKMKIWRQSL